jgi:hypothetical protein
MEKHRVIDIAQLQRAVNRLLDHVLMAGVREVTIEQPLYWTVVNPRSLHEQPSELGVGDLCDDLEFALGVLDPGAEPMALSLTEVAPLLAYVGEVVSARGMERGA